MVSIQERVIVARVWELGMPNLNIKFSEKVHFFLEVQPILSQKATQSEPKVTVTLLARLSNLLGKNWL